MAKKIVQSSNFLTDVEIKNFKSIKHLKFKPKRVNLFIGKPNSGKSNLLEALSLLGDTYNGYEGRFLESFIRFDSYSQLFFNLDQSNAIEIKTNIGNAWLRYLKGIDSHDLIIGISEEQYKKEILKLQTIFEMEQFVLSNKNSSYILKPFYKSFKTNVHYQLDQAIPTPIKRYYFQSNLVKNYSDSFSLFLKPFGENLYSIIEQDIYLREIAGDFFKEYNLDFVFDIEKRKFLILKRIGKSVYSLPLLMTPDTFQRLLYYLAAIYSNNNSVLLFEEPEAHSFPPYIAMICELIAKKQENQYFISTHSPYVYQTVISKTSKTDLGVWALSYSKGQTQMVQLTEKQISETLVFGEGVDVFSNIERYIK